MKTIEIPETGMGDVSDGYHTFNELYHHRAILFSVICNQNPSRSWKAKQHSDGTMFEGMFIVGINTDQGQATYHYDVDPYWDYFNVQVLDKAPEFDGYTPTDAINRLLEYGRMTMANYEEATSLFNGEMRDFTPEEAEAYEKSLSEIYKPTGINILEVLND